MNIATLAHHFGVEQTRLRRATPDQHKKLELIYKVDQRADSAKHIVASFIFPPLIARNLIDESRAQNARYDLQEAGILPAATCGGMPLPHLLD